ncbi:MAG: TrbI/VirB10 family protein [Pseudomonadales bacterium]|nr:TrbI/VirB10 family protein [Pseudomonadales bacterium]
MVRGFLFLACIFFSASTLSNEGFVSANELKSYLKATEKQRMSASERLKASRANPNNLKLLHEKDLYFKLPDGSYVLGILLPNGKISPALNISGDIIPACLTTENRLIPGKWDERNTAIVCKLSQNETFATLEDGVRQKTPVSIEEHKTELKKTADKYVATALKKAPNTKSALPNEERIQANKYGSNSHTASHRSSQGQLSYSNSEYIYRPPINRGSSVKTVAGVLDKDNKKFGIPIGTWIKARLMRPVSSAERGLIEFETKEPIFGKYRDLPAYTVLFAQKYVNEADEKMEAITVNARLPNGEEIEIKASIHSPDQTAGLHGKLIRDRAGEVMVASTKAALGAISELSPEGRTSPSKALNSITDSLIDNENRYIPRTPGAVIRVSEQDCLLKIIETF